MYYFDLISQIEEEDAGNEEEEPLPVETTSELLGNKKSSRKSQFMQ